MTLPALTEPELIVDSQHGVYVPQVWAQRYGSQAIESANVDEEDVNEILKDPYENEFYWEAWERILNDYCHVVDGIKHYIDQIEGDLFEYPETYEFPENETF
jgi:hypothetical protein